MHLVETHILNNKEIEAVCIKAKLLYNQALYYVRQSIFGKIQYFSEYELMKVFAEYGEETYKLLPAQTSQQIIRLLFKNIKCWQKARKEYYKNPAKFLGRPKLPSYKKETSIVIFTSQQLKIKDGFIHFPEKSNLKPLKTMALNVCQVRIVPQACTFKIEIVYEKEATDLDLSKSNVLSIDMGLNNFVTAIDNVGNKPFIINGKPLKSFNHWYNKKKAKLQSFIGEKRISKKLKALSHYRNCFVDDKMHKMSKYVVDYCIENNIGTIVIGKNKQWKQSINIGSKNNQKFVELPHARLISKIAYKALLVGIELKVNEESYTSKCDALALELIKKHETYLGKRKKRGLFQSSIGQILNADVNGGINIGRKVIGDSFAKMVLNSGQAFCPIKINVF